MLAGVGLGIMCPFALKIMVIYAAITITCRRGRRVLILDVLIGGTSIRWTILIGSIRKTTAIYRSDSRPVVAIVVGCIVVIWVLMIWVECRGYVASRVCRPLEHIPIRKVILSVTELCCLFKLVNTVF